MSKPWSEIAAFYHQFAGGRDENPYWLACCGIGSLASTISQNRLSTSLFGWTSMHDLCIQQCDLEAFSGPYLRIAPLHSGHVEFCLIDTPSVARQWRREVDPMDTTKRFVGFLAQIKWTDEDTAASLLLWP